MTAIDLIDHAVPFLKPADRISNALEIMADNHLSYLPLVNKGKLETIVSEDHLLEYDDNAALSDIEKLPSEAFVMESDHLLAIIRTFAEYNLPVLPVVDDKDNYLGCITPSRVLGVTGKQSWASAPGGVLVLEVNAGDFSLAEVARIAESNNAAILYLDTNLNRETEKMELTIKVSREDLKDIMQSFERFNYEVKATYHASSHNDNLKERYDSLMMYLNV